MCRDKWLRVFDQRARHQGCRAVEAYLHPGARRLLALSAGAEAHQANVVDQQGRILCQRRIGERGHHEARIRQIRLQMV